ncbi:MAG: HXXEE domain-containing protein [Muribaculaceae bacterium]
MNETTSAILLLIAFALHDGEEILVMQHWLHQHRDSIIHRFPKMKKPLNRLTTMGTRGFAIAVVEEFVILLIAAILFFAGVPYSFEILSALFISFVVHQAIHIAQAMALRLYVPGLITNILLLPATITGLMFIIHSHPLTVIAICSVCGIAVMAINLRIVHHLGTKFHIK